MVQTTKVWEYYSNNAALRKRFGSKRSGTIYVIADSFEEAKEAVKQLQEQAGLVPEKNSYVSESCLLKQAVRMIF